MIFEAYGDIKHTKPRAIEPEKQSYYLIKKAETPKVLRMNSPDALVSNRRLELKSLNPSKVDKVHMSNAPLKVNTPEWKIRVKSHTNSSDQNVVRTQVPKFEIFNGKELHAIFTHFKSIVQTSNTFPRKEIHEEGYSKIGFRRSHWINYDVINFILQNLDKDKQDLFYNTWNFRSSNYISWDDFHDRIKTVSFDNLYLRY